MKMPGKVQSMMSTGLTEEEAAELESLRQRGGVNPQAALSKEELARYMELESRNEDVPMMQGKHS